ncbi:MAG: hypothetical protein J3Q66DRAFT_358708 [Benniella sp.]|nr:MAG: hypothetical protein J3Q66DRAFT_358708 [Benniella sp.]
MVPTESIDSPTTIQADRNSRIPFFDSDDSDEESSEGYDDNTDDFVLPDKVENEFNFVGDLDRFDVASRFESFFAEIKKKAVYIEDTEEALGRSGILFLDLLCKKRGILKQVKKEMLRHWHTVGVTDFTAPRNQARSWLDAFNKDAIEVLSLILVHKGVIVMDPNVLKVALDLIQDKYGVDDATLVGSQVISQTMRFYLVQRCGNLYIMVQ